MRGRGINYDTGFLPGGHTSRESFDPETVREEMRVVAEELNCTAVRVTGGDPERIGVAARHVRQHTRAPTQGQAHVAAWRGPSSTTRPSRPG
ncbi:hypothetical protein [Microbispora triticiradicis]|uniref:hypothetical protein n=1 Tax=Microbispora TaxID=2005 RepID=UPI001651D222|nr:MULTISPECIES: hypothetical protein [Microbispora]